MKSNLIRFEYFEIFVPKKKMPRTVGEAHSCGHYEIQTIADRFSLYPILQQVKNRLTCLSQWFKKMVIVTS